MPVLSSIVDGIAFANPFLIASGPPGTNANVICRALDEGWGGVVCKTVCLDADTILNVHPRYARLRSQPSGDIVGWENIELISDRPFEVWLDDFKQIKDRHPDRPLIASIMEEYRREAWEEIVSRCEAAGVDALELNLSCPHGLPERRMGSAMGEDPELLEEVAGWVAQVATVPVWAKLTPNVTYIEPPARAALRAGCNGISAINTIRAVLGVDLETLRPLPTVAGHSTAGGYSCAAIRPVALRMCIEIAKVIRNEFPNRTLSGIGGIESGNDALPFLLMGCDTVQVCTAVMKSGYGIIRQLVEETLAFMEHHQFETIDQFKGHSLQYMTSHSQLVDLQRGMLHGTTSTDDQAIVTDDEQWSGDRFVDQSERLTRG